VDIEVASTVLEDPTLETNTGRRNIQLLTNVGAIKEIDIGGI
jgi:hypothetical protein